MAEEPKTIDCLIPLEICSEILIRLPAKSILRFRSVCKSWYSLIASPNFISDYSVKTLNRNGHRLLLQTYDYDYRDKIAIAYRFSSLDESFMESSEHDDVPEAYLDSNVLIVGSCNGLVCLCKYEYDEVKENFLIWNPTLRKVIEVPSGRYYSSFDSLAFSYYGFGFDSKTGDYKVMCTHRSYCDENLCEIFDLKKGVWRRISHPLLNSWHVGGHRRTPSPECYLDGAAHWSESTTLSSFDMSDEIFREIRMPDFVWSGDVDDDDSRVETRCVASGGLIHVIVWKTLTKREGYAVDMYKECSVWAMKEYGVAESWTKLFNIDLLGAGVCEDIEPNKFRLWKNGEVLMVHDFLDVEGREDYDSEDEDYYDDEEYDSDEDMELVDRQGLLLYNTEGRKCKNGEVLMVDDFPEAEDEDEEYYVPEDEDDYDDEEYDSDEDMELVDKQGLLLYNPESRKCKQLFSSIDRITDMCLYEESLVLM